MGAGGAGVGEGGAGVGAGGDGVGVGGDGGDGGFPLPFPVIVISAQATKCSCCNGLTPNPELPVTGSYPQ